MKELTKEDIERLEGEFYRRDHFPSMTKFINDLLDRMLEIAKRNLLSKM